MSATMGRRGIRQAIVLAAALALVVGATPFAARTAFALQGCPAFGTSYIQSWSTAYINRGVTMCLGIDYSGQAAVWLQIVDFSAGAKMRVVSQVASGSTPGTPDTLFNKRSAYDWYNWISSNITTPPSSRLFSTTNASFFITTSGTTTALSLPEKMANSVRSQGYALTHHTDPAWPATKRKFALGDPNSTPQTFVSSTFPTSYTATDITNGFSGYYDGTIALDALYGDVFARKTMLGFNGSRVYILTTLSLYYLSQARSILRDNFSTANEIQLDGGNSTQMNSNYGVLTSSSNRVVPDVLAVYLAP